jgi:hypothetical protein
MNCKIGDIVRIKDIPALEKATNVRSIHTYANRLAKVYDIWEEMDRYYLDIDEGVYGWSDITVDKLEVDCPHCHCTEAYFDEDNNLVCDCCETIIQEN